MLHAIRCHGIPAHIKNLWQIRKQARDDLRDRQIQLDYRITTKQWINLPPISQAKLWYNKPQIKNNWQIISSFIVSYILSNTIDT